MSALPDFVEAWIDGVATPEEAERLQAWLRADREHPRALMRAMRLYQALRDGHQGMAQPERRRKGSPRLVPRRGRQRRAWGALVAAACLVVAASVTVVALRRPVPAELRFAHVDGAVPTGAQVWRQVGGVQEVAHSVSRIRDWHEDRVATPLVADERLVPDDVIDVGDGGAVSVTYDAEDTRLSLAAGSIAQLELGVHAERKFVKSILLRRGSLTAQVAKQGPDQELACRASDGVATVIGTRFAIEARVDGSRLDVTEGRVRFRRDRDRAEVEVAAGECADTADATFATKPIATVDARWAAHWARWPKTPFADPGFFPIAVWSQDPAQAASYRKLGVNLFVALWQGPTEAQLAQLKAAGMATICAQNEVGLAHRDDPTIAGWFLDEGPDNAKDGKHGRDPAEVLAQYRSWSAADPTRPVLCNFGPGAAMPDWFGRGQDGGKNELYPRWLKAADIASFDLYPVANCADPKAQGQLWRIADGVDNLQTWATRADPAGRPVWAMLESGRIRDGGPRPTREQLRAEAWMAIVHGATGIGWFCHRFGPGDAVDPAALLHDAEASAAVAAIDAEIAAHARALNRASARGVSAGSGDPDAPVDVIAKPDGASLFIAAVAMRDRAAPRAEITLPWPARVVVVGESREIEAGAGSFHDSFGPYGVHLYQATPTGR